MPPSVLIVFLRMNFMSLQTLSCNGCNFQKWHSFRRILFSKSSTFSFKFGHILFWAKACDLRRLDTLTGFFCSRFPLNPLRFNSHQRNWHKKSWAVLQYFIFWKIELTKTPTRIEVLQNGTVFFVSVSLVRGKFEGTRENIFYKNWALQLQSSMANLKLNCNVLYYCSWNLV